MPIMGLEAVVYGADDIDTAARFLSDFGLETHDSGANGATLAVAGEGTRVELRKQGDTSLPEVVEAGPTLREIVWAVSDKAALQEVAAEVSRDRNVIEDSEGRLHVKGPGGFGFAFEVTKAKRETAPPQRAAHAANERFRGYQKATPDHLGHMGVFFQNPAGSTIEYHCDEDFIVDVGKWQAREWEPRTISHWGGPPPAEMVGGSGFGQPGVASAPGAGGPSPGAGPR